MLIDNEYDKIIALNYMKGRFQFPMYAKFNRPDPQRDWDWLRPHTLNLYEYVGNDPVNMWDPMGFSPAKDQFNQNRGFINGRPDYIGFFEEQDPLLTGDVSHELKFNAGQSTHPLASDPDYDKKYQFIPRSEIRPEFQTAPREGDFMYTLRQDLDPVIGLMNLSRILASYIRDPIGTWKQVHSGQSICMFPLNIKMSLPARNLWSIERFDKVVNAGRFGNVFRDPETGMWWSKDTSGHGGSAWKVFKETKTGLRWIEDADQYGTFLTGKHKSSTGEFIPWKQTSGVK